LSRDCQLLGEFNDQQKPFAVSKLCDIVPSTRDCFSVRAEDSRYVFPIASGMAGIHREVPHAI
jgi:hypothetical protein